MFMVYEVSTEDGFDCSAFWGEYIVELQVPGLCACGDAHGTQVSQTVVEASLVLPPHKSSEGLREPNVPNPYLGERDASYALGHDCHADITDGMFPPTEGWNPYEGEHQDIAPEAVQWDAWKLGAKDLESMFFGYFRSEEDELTLKVETAEIAMGYEMACKGLSEPVLFDDVSCDCESYFSRYYADVRGSEWWSDTQLQDVTYTYGVQPELPEPEVYNAETHLEWV